MNVRISKTWAVSAVVVSELYENLQINDYVFRADMMTVTPDMKQYNIAYQRICHWFENAFRDCVLISAEHPKIKLWQDLGEKLIIFPAEPVDQLVGIATFCKLLAITESRLDIQQLEISSPSDDYVTYRHSADEETGIFSRPGWWNDPGPTANDGTTNRRHGRVIKLNRSVAWKDLSLEWQPEPDLEAVITSFVKDEKK
jgi:hypothetical protein